MNPSPKMTPELLSKLQNLSIKAKYVVEGFMIGLHKSPYHGFSVEFSEHRPYGIGDEVRHIDWKLWSKTNKYYVKQFEEETNLKANIILDQSNSMRYASEEISKFEYAKILAVDKSENMLSMITNAWRKNHGLKEIVCRAQDLFKNPILKDELKLFDTVIIDPPRSGAEVQINEIATSSITRVSSVSCNPKTFSRDARILIDSGFTLDWVQPIDQFLWSSHIEIVSQFSR